MNDEFIETNILGGYVSYDLARGLTRKYHGLLIAADEQGQRHNVVQSLQEKLIVADEEYDFSAHTQTSGEAKILKYLNRAYFLPYPTQDLKIANITIKKQIEFDLEINKVKVIYHIQSPVNFHLEVTPLLTYRNFHDLGLPLNLGDIYILNNSPIQKVQLSDNVELKITSDFEYTEQKNIVRDVYYPIEEERGYEAREDLLSVGVYRTKVSVGVSTREITFKLDYSPRIRKIWKGFKQVLNANPSSSIASDVTRFNLLNATIDDNFAEFLAYNARKFIVRRNSRFSLIAGYHWFGEWSRDTFIGFKGIILGMGRFYEAQKMLLEWSKYISKGLLPNNFDGYQYNSIDGVLWYVLAVWHYWEATKDRDTIKHLLPKLERVIYGLNNGSEYGISVNTKGYLVWQDNSKALTWMDAIVNETPVTGRMGAAVEIQALWYNALQIVEKLALLNNYKLLNLNLIDHIEHRLESNFHSDFWNNKLGYYADFIDNNGQHNYELRPNQLALYGLPFILGDAEKFKGIVEKVEVKLLTQVGLRTLSPESPSYIGSYTGGHSERDKAYHQGTVWTWPLILYYNSLYNHYQGKEEGKAAIKKHLEQFWEYIKDKGLISLPEIYSGDNLEPNGAIAQAWSVAALIEGAMLLNE